MSFILDALRKSENARQRQGGPALAEVPIIRRREARPWWIWAVAALLAINLIVLLFVLTREPETVPVAVQPIPAAPPAASTVAPAVAPTAPTPTAAAAPTQLAPAAVAAIPPGSAAGSPSLAEEAAANEQARVDDPDAPSGSVVTASNVPDRAPIVRSLTPGSPPAANTSGGEENLPTLNELTGERAVGIPAMHLDIHVYSANPAERFVFINMRKYTEGATLSEGPILERIRTDGVVLNQRGFRFVLPRQ